jgi:hypothetical protein
MDTKRPVAFFKIFLILLVAAWFALFAAGAGVLVKSNEVREDVLVPKLVCTYFTGLGFTDKEHVLTDISLIGKQVCPRFIEF